MSNPRVVVLGIAAQYPLAGVTWQAIHYLVGLRDLGCDVFYVEDSGAPPYDPVSGGIGVSADANVTFLADVMRRYGFADRWAYWNVLDDSWHGRDVATVRELYRGLQQGAEHLVTAGARKPGGRGSPD